VRERRTAQSIRPGNEDGTDPIGDSSFLTVEAYRKVVRLDATSRLGQAAQQRIDRIQNIMRVLYYDPYTLRRLRQGPGRDAGGDARRLCRDGGTWLLLVANWIQNDWILSQQWRRSFRRWDTLRARWKLAV
jgi:hypothetical protein